MLTTSAVEKLKHHQFPLVLPSNGNKQSISDYTTPMNPQYALDPGFKWQVGLSGLSYWNTISTMSTAGNTFTLLAPTSDGAYTRVMGHITAKEYLSPQAFVTQFNTDVAAIITATNTVTAGTFPTDASLVLTIDTNTWIMTLTHKNVGVEILVRNGVDILKILGQGNELTDIRKLPVIPLTYDFLPPYVNLIPPYSTNTWVTNALINTGIKVTANYNAVLQPQMWKLDHRAKCIHQYKPVSLYPPQTVWASITSISTYISWLNTLLSNTIA